jgi:hypothetical protein
MPYYYLNTRADIMIEYFVDHCGKVGRFFVPEVFTVSRKCRKEARHTILTYDAIKIASHSRRTSFRVSKRHS